MAATRGRKRKRASEQPYTLRLPSELHRELMVYKTLHRRPLNDMLLELIELWWTRQAARRDVIALIKKTEG